MNNLIEKLAEQCTVSCIDGRGVELNEIDVEKFAELIVRECMTICDTEKADYAKNRKGAWDFEEKNIYAEGEAACDTVKYKIKRQFAVEE